MSKRGELKSHVFAWWVHMMTKREIMGASRLVIIIEWKMGSTRWKASDATLAIADTL